MEDYRYELPSELVAHAPAEPRDSARLLVYLTDRDEVIFDTFANIANYIPTGSLLALNDTRVVPARIECVKPDGASVRILFLFNEWDRKGPIKGLPDRRLDVGDSISVDGAPVARVVSQKNQEFSFEPFMSADQFIALALKRGTTPLPPYIQTPLTESDAREKYQTIFAAPSPASVAAPTASLHFTERVFDTLTEKGIDRVYVTLHVGRGTFSPVTQEMVASERLHTEPINIPAESAAAISAAKKEGRPVIAAGTTAVRALESVSAAILSGAAYGGDTSLMIKPPYGFAIVDGLITNFHMPGTSLLMLVDAFLQSKGARKSWRELYEIAIREKFRFYSFGDAMLIM